MTTKLTVRAIETVFASPLGHNSRAYWIPMRYHADVLKAYRDAGIKIRTRFRGPRDPNRMMTAINGRTYRRGKYSAQITCLKCEATHFTVYGR